MSCLGDILQVEDIDKSVESFDHYWNRQESNQVCFNSFHCQRDLIPTLLLFTLF
jgi:hypothetical protein